MFTQRAIPPPGPRASDLRHSPENRPRRRLQGAERRQLPTRTLPGSSGSGPDSGVRGSSTMKHGGQSAGMSWDGRARLTFPRTRSYRMASRLADEMESAPVVILALAVGGRHLAHSVYPSVQNLLLAARALGIGTVLTTLHPQVMERVYAMFEIPTDVEFHCCIPLGYPRGRFGPTKRYPDFGDDELGTMERESHRGRDGTPQVETGGLRPGSMNITRRVRDRTRPRSRTGAASPCRSRRGVPSGGRRRCRSAPLRGYAERPGREFHRDRSTLRRLRSPRK